MSKEEKNATPTTLRDDEIVTQPDAGRRSVMAVAGVAVVTACLDGNVQGLPQGAQDWVLRRAGTPVPNHLARKAGRALERVLRDSELRDSWAESQEFAAWIAGIERLRARLP